MLFYSVASLPFFMSINSERQTKEKIVEALEKENLDLFKYENSKPSSEREKKVLNVISDNNNGGDVSLKENTNKLNTNVNADESQVILKKKRCC